MKNDKKQNLDSNNNHKILIVDDEKNILKLLSHELESMNFKTITVETAENALEIINKQNVDIIILDLILPFMSGLEFMKKLKESQIYIPTIVITGFATRQNAISAIKLGAVNYITKPFELEEISRGISKIIKTFPLSFSPLSKNYKEPTNEYKTIEINIPSDIELIRGVSTRILEEAFSNGIINKENEMPIRLALDEALANAIEHGNNYGVQKLVNIKCTFASDKLEITIKDEGRGFSPEAVFDPRDEENILASGGRGIFLIKCYMDEVKFNKQGNEITMIKYII